MSFFTRLPRWLALWIFLFVAVFGIGDAVHAEGNAEGEADLMPDFDLFFQSYFYLANDSDFDRTEPIYEKNGQSVGYMLTTFRPGLTWTPMNNITLRYQLEIGDNVWSRNDLDGQDPNSQNTAVVRHKLVWGEVLTPGGHFGIKTGYQYFHDPTHLVIDRHMGLAQTFWQWSAARLSFAAGQVPDTVYEGFAATSDGDQTEQNNFEQDDYIFALWLDWTCPKGWRLSPGTFFRWDKTEIGRPKGILSAVFNAHGGIGPRTRLDFDLVGQYGQYKNGGLDNRDVDYLAASAQLGARFDIRPVFLRYNALVFTADDGDKHDQYNTGFHYSGLSKSKTMVMSLNWMHDQYDNLDERAAAQGAGLALFDQEASLALAESVKLITIIGVGMTLDGTHTNDSTYLGTEAHAGVEWAMYDQHVAFTLLGGGLMPGKAAAVLKNKIDLDATESMGVAQAAMNVQF